MSWDDFYRRRDLMDAVLRQAAEEPGTLPFDRVPGVPETFGSEEALLLALHYKWSQLLGGRMRAELAEPEGDTGTDQVDAVTRAWQATVSEHEALRTLIDEHLDSSPALMRRHEAELRMLAVAAGLAEADEEAGELTQVGSAFVALLRHGPQVRPARRRSTMGSLLRMLAPSA